MKTIKIGMLGLGTVGSGVVKILQENNDIIKNRLNKKIEVKKILVKNINKQRDIVLDSSVLTTKIEEIVDDPEIDIIIEVMGGVEPAKDYILSAISKCKHIVTANKELIAKEGFEIFSTAKEKGVNFYFEASVAGGIPIINAIKNSLSANKILSLVGIINGTTNYILTKMSNEGRDFDSVLKEAQKAGYAETYPTSDIEGFDVAYKLAILSLLSFNTKVNIDDIYREGIKGISPEDIAFGKEFGYVIKLLAIGKRIEDKLELRVHPTFIPANHPLASVNDTFNAILINGNAVGDLMFYGRGAGDLPTGSAVVADLISVIEGMDSKTDFNFISDKNLKVLSVDDYKSKYFIRLNVIDKPGVIAKIATIFGDNNVSISSIIQKEKGQFTVPLVFITHEVKEKDIKISLSKIKNLKVVEEICNIIRVEDYKK